MKHYQILFLILFVTINVYSSQTDTDSYGLPCSQVAQKFYESDEEIKELEQLENINSQEKSKFETLYKKVSSLQKSFVSPSPLENPFDGLIARLSMLRDKYDLRIDSSCQVPSLNLASLRVLDFIDNKNESYSLPRKLTIVSDIAKTSEQKVYNMIPGIPVVESNDEDILLDCADKASSASSSNDKDSLSSKS